MDITFSIPHAFGGDSTPALAVGARKILNDGLARLNRSPVHSGRHAVRYRIHGHYVTWTLPKVFGAGHSEDDNAFALRCLLDTLVQLNLDFIKFGPRVTIPGLYQSGVVYDRTVIWDTLPALYARKYGDCKSLTAALVAQYIATGTQAAPVFRFKTRADGAFDFHILVQTALYGFEDPSRILGMGKNENMIPIRGLAEEMVM